MQRLSGILVPISTLLLLILSLESNFNFVIADIIIRVQFQICYYILFLLILSLECNFNFVISFFTCWYYHKSPISTLLFHSLPADIIISIQFQLCYFILYLLLSYDVASGSEITPCNKICKPLVVYRFTGNVITSITTLRTWWQNHNVFTPEMGFQRICHMINRI